MNIALLVLILFSFDDVYASKKRKYNASKIFLAEKHKLAPDRYFDEIWKPPMAEKWVNRYQKQFHPAWMDYCDPYHCNDYHKTACGLNRDNMKFKWFQSGCHIQLNNLCATYRGNLRYDPVQIKFCAQYVMFLRDGCPSVCPDVMAPRCGISSFDNHIALFINKCAMDRANCRAGVIEEYEEVDMKICSGAINFMK